jgi:hypothetical protein
MALGGGDLCGLVVKVDADTRAFELALDQARRQAAQTALFAEIDGFAPNLLDVLMAAVGGDPAALTRLEKVATCRDVHPTPQ